MQEDHRYHVIQGHHAVYMRWHLSDPKPVGFVSSYKFGENYTRSMAEHPSINKQHPVYASKPEGLTTREWETDDRTKELYTHIRRLEQIIESYSAQVK